MHGLHRARHLGLELCFSVRAHLTGRVDREHEVANADLFGDDGEIDARFGRRLGLAASAGRSVAARRRRFGRVAIAGGGAIRLRAGGANERGTDHDQGWLADY